MTLSQSQVDLFWERGFIHLRSVISAAKLAPYASEICRLVYEQTATENRDESVYRRAFRQICNLSLQSEKVRELGFDRNLARTANKLLRTRGVRWWQDAGLLKESESSGGGISQWHRDIHFWPHASGLACTFFIALEDMPIEMGPLTMAIGSHKIDPDNDPEFSENGHRKVEAEMLLRGMEFHTEALKAGDMSVHLSRTFHCAGLNHTNEVRKAFTISYTDIDMRLAAPKNHNQQAEYDYIRSCGIKDGGVIDAPRHPIIPI